MFQKRNKKILSSLLCIAFVNFSTIATAQTTTSTNAKFTFLNKGDVAPFNGTLFSVEATAKLLAERENNEQACKLQLQYETDKLKAKCARDLDLITSELQIEKKKYNIIVAAQDEEIKRLQQISLDSGEYDMLWFGGGVTLGIITSIAIFFASVEIVKK